ncbi:MAG: polysaccharide biosynthesis/export family protein [Calditrichia bacterium]|nr:polysaccharide biosynthesis/export family protein [Calditrichia bacterium]
MKNKLNIFLMILITLVSFSLMYGQGTKNPYKPGNAILIYTYPDTASLISNNYYMINDAGEINLPIVGRLKITGMDEIQLLETLKAAFAKYIRSTNIQVDVFYRISLLGGFENPGLYYARPDETLWEVVRKSGGFLAEDGFKEMKIYRGEERIYKNIADEYSFGRSIRQLKIKSGDVVTVPIPSPRVDNFGRFTQVLGIVTTGITMYLAYVTMIINSRR